MNVARFLAGIAAAENKLTIERDGFVTLYEPCCGSGGIIIAHAVALKELGYEPKQVMRMVATDIDPAVAYMCYIQLSVLRIPAEVRIGDSLSGEICESLFTPAYVLSFISECVALIEPLE